MPGNGPPRDCHVRRDVRALHGHVMGRFVRYASFALFCIVAISSSAERARTESRRWDLCSADGLTDWTQIVAGIRAARK
jgi:hypothetical protein